MSGLFVPNVQRPPAPDGGATGASLSAVASAEAEAAGVPLAGVRSDGWVTADFSFLIFRSSSRSISSFPRSGAALFAIRSSRAINGMASVPSRYKTRCFSSNSINSRKCLLRIIGFERAAADHLNGLKTGSGRLSGPKLRPPAKFVEASLCDELRRAHRVPF